jgi:hypothetical protein
MEGFEKLPAYLGVPSVEITAFPGGFSNLTYQVGAGDATYVLRRPPHGLKIAKAHDMIREFRVLQALEKAGYTKIPHPISACEDESVIGAPFFLMEKVEGMIIRNRPPSQASPQFFRSLSQSALDVLIELHSLELSESGLGADGCLVLQGKQGIGKTEFFKYLCSFAPKYFLMGAELKFDNKDTLIKAIGHWITELGEVEGTLKKSEVTDLKNFITADEDMVRLPYGRDPRNSPRITSFCASCNSTEFLRDETGNRRFWIVQINQRINRKDMYAIDVLQLWKQIYDQAIVSFENHGFRLSDAEQEENTRRSNDFQVPLKGEDEVRDKLCKITANENHTMEKITVTDWMERVGGFQKCSTRDVAKILTKLGYEVKRGGIDGSRFRILPLIEFLL